MAKHRKNTAETEPPIFVFLGADLNCYGMARAVWESRREKSYAFGKTALGATAFCPFIRFQAVPDLSDPVVLRKTLDSFAADHPGSRILFPCTDEYVRLLSELHLSLSRDYIVMAPTKKECDLLQSKEAFYRMADLFRIPYPKTRILSLPLTAESISAEKNGFPYPAILKPSEGVSYFSHPFPDMQKVYLVSSPAEVLRLMETFQKAGYIGKTILQDRVPGPDDCIHVITFYSDRNAAVKAVAAGRVLLEEHTPKGLGNHAAILSEKPPEIYRALSAMLERIGYRGFCHFDLKYDVRTGSYKVFEINLRQGRSNHYLTAMGCNPIDLVIKDRIEKNSLQFKEYFDPVFWYSIPRSTVYRYTEDKLAVREARRLCRSGKSISGLPGKQEAFTNPLLGCYRLVHDFREKKKYKKYRRKERAL